MSSLPKNVTVQWFPVLAFSVIFICFFAACHLYYMNQHDRIKATIHEELASIADLKVQQISNWRQERIRDIQLFADDPGFAEYVRTGGDRQLEKELLSLMRSTLKLQGYHNIMIADAHGTPRLSAIKEIWTPPAPELIQRALTEGRTVLGDLTRAAGSDAIYLDMIAPLLQADSSAAPTGLIVVRIDPHQFLYPYIQTWPSPSPSAETLLMRREGDAIIYLNELRHRKNTALSLRESVKDKEQPAARFLRGETGVEEVIDYRGKPVLTAARPVPDTPWLIVAKVDTQEISEPLRRQALTAAVVLGLLVLGAAIFAWGFWSRRQAEELRRSSLMQGELRAEQDKLLVAFSAIEDGIFISNSQYHLEYTNPAIENRFGPVDGRTCYQYFSGLDHACPWCTRDTVAPGETTRRDCYHELLGRHFDIMTTPIKNPDGSISILHIIHDITEIKQSAQALKDSEDKFRSCVEQYRDGIVLCDTDGKVVQWNRELERITQLPRTEVIGKYIWDINYAIMPDEAKNAAVYHKHKEMVQSVLSTGDNPWDIQPFEILFRRTDGTHVNMQNILFPIKTRDAFMWGGICRDITQRKLMEEALCASENKYRELVEYANSIILRMDIKGVIVFANAFARQFFGYEEAEIIGRNVIGAIVPERESTGRDLEQMIDDICCCPDKFADNENENMRKNGGRVWIGWSNKALRDEAGKIKEILCIGHDITARKKAQDALLASETRLKSSQQLAHLGDWEFNFKTGEVYWSDELYRLLEYAPGEIAPSFKSWIKSVYHDDRRTMLNAVAYRGTAPRKDEYRMVPRKGSLRYIYAETWVVADTAGKSVLARGILQDITLHKMIEKELSRHHDKLDELVHERTAKMEKEMLERRKTEEELRASETRFRGLVANIPGVVYRIACDQERPIFDWTIEYVSANAETISGRSASYFLGNTVGSYLRMIHADDADIVAQTLAENISKNQPYTLEYRVMHADGSLRWVMSRGQALKDAQGRLLWLDGVIIDISDRKQAEQTLHESEERFRAIAESTPDAIIVTDEDYNILYWNNGAACMFGYAAEEVLGKSHTFLLPPLQQQQEQQAVSAFKNSGRRSYDGTAFETMAVKKDGALFPMELSIAFWTIAEKIYTGVIIRDCTQRKKTDEALRNSEAQFRAFAETSPDCVIMADMQMNILYWNTAAENIFGYSSQEMMGRQPDCLMSPAAMARQEKALKTLQKTGGSPFLNGFVETVALKKNCVEFPCELAVFQWETQEQLFLGVILRDITDRKLAEEALRQSQDRYMGMLNAITTYTYSVEVEDKHDIAVHHSPGCFAVTGYHPENYEKNPLLWHSMIHPDDRSMVERALAAMHAGQQPSPLEHRIIKIDGSTVWVRNTMVPYRDESSRLLRYDGIIENITERKLAEEALRTSQEMLDGILSAITEYIIMVNEDLTIVWANEHALKAFGKDIVGRHCHEVYHGNAAPCDECSARNCFVTGRPAEHEQVIITPEGRELNVWCTTSVAARYENGKPSHLIYIAHDITERKMMQAEALRTSHLASIGELAAGVAHEINNPINGIINCADILKHQFDKKGEDADIPGRIIKEGERVARIVKNLLTFAREQKGKTEPQNISAIYADAFALLSKQLEKDFILTRHDFPEGLPLILAQPQQIQQVFINLLSNARYALNKKYPDKDPGKQLNITAQTAMFDDQQYVRIIFHDLGTGVSESDLEKLCNPFFSTKPAGEGTGLGLSISYNIIKDHGGRLLFETSQGEYMRVMVDLPTAVT